MPNWENIENVTANPQKVWLSRLKDAAPTDDWKPLRKCDCFAMNDANPNKTKSQQVIIEGGRSTADKEQGLITANFHRAPDRALCSAIWFVKKGDGGNNNNEKSKSLEPISNEADSKKIETLYQMAIEASTDFGQGIESMIKEEIELEDGSKVFLSLTSGGTVVSIKKKPPGWLSSSLDLQRGYGSYTVEGEDIELMLGPVRHLIFVVHGIGESIWTRDDSKIPSLLDEINRIRVGIQKRQVEEWKRLCEVAKKEGKAVPKMPNRIEWIPIEWYDQIHNSSSALTKSLKATTLPTVSALRAIANEAVFDVMLYLTPAFCEPILSCVTKQINTMYSKFLELNPTFLSDGGRCSLIGHSLGSVICWDLLSVLKDHKTNTETAGQAVVSDSKDADIGLQAYAKENADTSKNGSWGPALPKALQETIAFMPEFAIFLGSPIGLFLTLRGAHPVFNEMRESSILDIAEKMNASQNSRDDGSKTEDDNSKDEALQMPYASPFTLPCGSLYNIFHPSDPVAYRIEPLLLPPEMHSNSIPPPIHLTAEGQSVRLHVKAQQIGDEIGRIATHLFEGKNKGGFSTIFTQAVSALGKVEQATNSQRSVGTESGAPQNSFPLGGNSPRVDFQLQRGVVDNEYLSAVSAHSNYFVNSDFQDFLMSICAKVDDTAKQAAPPAAENVLEQEKPSE